MSSFPARVRFIGARAARVAFPRPGSHPRCPPSTALARPSHDPVPPHSVLGTRSDREPPRRIRGAEPGFRPNCHEISTGTPGIRPTRFDEHGPTLHPSADVQDRIGSRMSRGTEPMPRSERGGPDSETGYREESTDTTGSNWCPAERTSVGCGRFGRLRAADRRNSGGASTSSKRHTPRPETVRRITTSSSGPFRRPSTRPVPRHGTLDRRTVWRTSRSVAKTRA
jgi:hypothetical protein